MKDTFSPHTFASSTFACGTFAGLGATAAPPDAEGLEYTMPDARLHFTFDTSRLHYAMPDGRLHYTIEQRG